MNFSARHRVEKPMVTTQDIDEATIDLEQAQARRRERKEKERLDRRWYVFAKFEQGGSVANAFPFRPKDQMRWATRGDGSIVRLEQRHDWRWSASGVRWFELNRLRPTHWHHDTWRWNIDPAIITAMLVALDSWIERGGGAGKITVINRVKR